MNSSVIKHYLSVTVLLSVPLLLAIFSYFFFQKSSMKILAKLDTEKGKVAGAETKKEVTDLTSELPIMPDAEIVSLDTSNGVVQATLESAHPADENQTYYEDYIFANNWTQTEKDTYTKGDKTLKIEISDNIIKLTLIP